MIKKIILLQLMLAACLLTNAQTDSLYKTIVRLDSILFHAYNTCDLVKQQELYSDSIEFYHDKGGLLNSRKDILEGIKNNVCGKVTRRLVKGSIEVSPVPGYGAVEIGMHAFYNNQEKNTKTHTARFVIIWRNNNGKWTVTRVISLH